MAMTVVKAKVPKLGGKIVSVNFDFGDNTAEASKLYGEKVIFDAYKAESVIALQSRLRDWAQKGKSDAEIAQLAAQWKPGAGGVRVAADPVTAFEKYVTGLDTDKAAEQLERLKKLLAEKKAAIKK